MLRLARGFAQRDALHAEVGEVADQPEDDEQRRPFAVAGIAERAHHERRDERAERQVADAHDDLHEDVSGGALPGGVAS